MTSGNYPIPVGTGGASLGVDGKAYSSGGSVHGSHSSGSGGGSMHGAPPTSGNRYYAGSVHSANYAPSTYKSQQTAVPLQTKGFYIPGAIETEDYSPLRKLHWILFALYLIQAIIMLPIAASIARGSIPMATAFSTFDPFRRIYINQIQDRGYYQPGGEICVVLFVDALMHLVNAVFHKQLSKVWDRTGCDYVRYLFSSLATAWLCFIVALVGGMHMIVYTLIAVSYLTLTFIWFMMCQDLANGNALNRRTTFWWPWTFAGFVWVGWIIQYWNYLFAYPFRSVVPKIVYAIVIFTTFFLLVWWLLQGLQYANAKYFRTFVAQARWQYSLLFVFHTLVCWLLFAALIWIFYAVDTNLAAPGTFSS